MYQIKTLNKISAAGLKVLDKANYTVSDSVESPDGILVRSADMLEYQFPESLRAIARAGAGTNNIPIDRCSEAGIVVFNTPGANANAVKELVVCALMMASRKIVQGSKWVDEQIAAGVDITTVVEKGKGQFVGPEIMGKTLGVVGLGAIGVQVANIATKLGMNVIGYDPFLSVHSALSLSRAVQVTNQLDPVLRSADYITIHVPQNKDTKGMINAAAITKMQDGVHIVNMARGGLVEEADLIAALKSGKVASYVTDFPSNAIAAAPNTICIPHLGASTPESEDNCAVMAAQELRDYLESGVIHNSVNLPDTDLPWSGVARLCVIHRNSPGMLNSITSVLAAEGINVENLTNKSKGEYAYTVVDIGEKAADKELDAIRAIDGVLRVRYLKH